MLPSHFALKATEAKIKLVQEVNHISHESIYKLLCESCILFYLLIERD